MIPGVIIVKAFVAAFSLISKTLFEREVCGVRIIMLFIFLILKVCKIQVGKRSI